MNFVEKKKKRNFSFLGQIRISSAYIASYSFLFAAVPALVVHAALYHGKNVDLFTFGNIQVLHHQF